MKTKLISLNITFSQCGCETNSSAYLKDDDISVEIEVHKTEPDPVKAATSSKKDVYRGQLSHLRVLDIPDPQLWHPWL